jgi:hypothetical protein
VSDLDAFHKHEALHTASLCANLIEEELCSHPYIKEHRDLLSLAEDACNNLAKLYQQIGAEKKADMVLVPREPTEAQYFAAYRVKLSSGDILQAVDVLSLYRAMIAAAGGTR